MPAKKKSDHSKKPRVSLIIPAHNEADNIAGVLKVVTQVPELDEILALSDRIAVMYKGEIIDIVERDVATRQMLGLLMAGVKEDIPDKVTR